MKDSRVLLKPVNKTGRWLWEKRDVIGMSALVGLLIGTYAAIIGGWLSWG